MNVSNISINDIGLSNRSIHALINAGTETVEDLLRWDADSLVNVRNLGAKSVAEILSKIEEYRLYVNLEQDVYFDRWIGTQEGRQFLHSHFEEKGTKIDELEFLPPKAYNLLVLNGYKYVYQLLFEPVERLERLPKVDAVCAVEIRDSIDSYLTEQKNMIIENLLCKLFSSDVNDVEIEDESFSTWIRANRNDVMNYVIGNDYTLSELGISNRGVNQLKNNGYELLSHIIFLTKEELLQLPRMGAGTVADIVDKIEQYLQRHEDRIKAFCNGDKSVLWSDEAIESKILELYESVPFTGFSLDDYLKKLELPDGITIQRLKMIIGGLIAKEQLEYVDFRCYRVYDKFESFLSACTEINDRNKLFIDKKLHGYTLDAIGQEEGVTRERVRQIIQKSIEKARNLHLMQTGVKWFDEDYYRYLYENYEVDRKVGIQWLGVSEAVWRYFELIDLKKGEKELKEALEDRDIDPGLRLKIKTYINRNKVCIDGVFVDRTRSAIEDFLLPVLCKEDVSYDAFTKCYNDYLKDQEIEYDETIYFTDEVYATRKNRLSDSRKLLWKYPEKMRYYDIDGQDYTEFLEVLNLESYDNIEISTYKFMMDYPDLMKHYDIRDHYELHNLLRKIVSVEEYPNFHCCRMPDIRFGEFDRTAALFALLKDNVPISMDDFAELIQKEYGYDKPTTITNYLPPFLVYCHQGVFSLEQKEMPSENMVLLKQALTKEFYYLEEVKNIYSNMFSDANSNEVNTYNLKRMGYTVLSKYVLTKHDTLEAYFEELFTKNDIVDLRWIKKRFTGIVAYYNKLMNLKRNLDVIEFEPDQIISIRKLESVGITKDKIREFCDHVYQSMKEGAYFTAKSLRDQGFVSELYEFGFDDCFYSGLLLSDERFSWIQTLGARIFIKGTQRFMTKDLIEYHVNNYGSIDIYDLMAELENVYGCKIEDKWDLISKSQSSTVFYDKVLERFYESEDMFYEELDSVND